MGARTEIFAQWARASGIRIGSGGGSQTKDRAEDYAEMEDFSDSVDSEIEEEITNEEWTTLAMGAIEEEVVPKRRYPTKQRRSLPEWWKTNEKALLENSE